MKKRGTIPGIKCDVVGNEIEVKKTALQSVRNLVIHSLYTSYGDVATHSALKLKKKNIAILNMFLSLALHLTFRKKIFPLDSFWDSFFWKIVKNIDFIHLWTLWNYSIWKIVRNIDFSHWGKQCLLSHYIAFFFENWFYEIFAPFFVDFKNHCAAMDDLQSMYSIGWYDVEADFGRLVAIQPLQNVEGTLQIFG